MIASSYKYHTHNHMDEYNQFFNKKQNKPKLLNMSETDIIEYDFNDIDGRFYMLDRDYGGCIYLFFSKSMNPNINGIVLLDGKPIKRLILKASSVLQGNWMLGIPVRGIVNEYNKAYQLHVEGFVDTDGYMMDPQDFIIKSRPKEEPREEYSYHEDIALKAAEEGIVLLKNKNNILPLKHNITLNVFGKALYQFRSCAAGAGKINSRYTIGLKEAITEFSDFSLNGELANFYENDTDDIPGEELLKKALNKSDIALVVISRATGENFDNSTEKGEFYLSIEEDSLLRKVTELFKHTICILNVGYSIDVTFADKYGVDALVYCGYGGMMGGKAVVEVLDGRVNPSGKLPDTWAIDYFDIPSSMNFYDCAGGKTRLDADSGIYVDTVYEEGIYVGYRYFETFGVKVAFPFGYGLSYTTFQIETYDFNYDPNKGVSMSVRVTNSGTNSGKEVVQVYVEQPDGRLEKPIKQLAFFVKTKELLSGEKQIISISIPKSHMCSYDEENAQYLMEAGSYHILVGNCVNSNTLSGSFELSSDEITKQVKNRMQPVTVPLVLSKKDPVKTWPKGLLSGVKEGINEFIPKTKRESFKSYFRKNTFSDTKKLTYNEIKTNPSLVDNFVSQMSIEELARLSICASSGWGMEGTGEAGRIFKLEGYEFPDFLVADGNSGVNMNKPNIGFPSGTTICASFNKELCEEIGKVIGEEAKDLGVSLILAPAFNIHRNPLNGRNPEYFSEDPYLAGVLAGWFSKGLEGVGIGSCLKHCIANNCETTRKRNQSIITERAIREIYFRAFELAMEVHMPAAIMTAYNAVNGEPTSTDEELIMGLFREENGFNGFAMTDWNSYDTAAVEKMIQAGNCWITPGSLDDMYTNMIVQGIEKGEIEEDRLRENAKHIIRTIIRFS